MSSIRKANKNYTPKVVQDTTCGTQHVVNSTENRHMRENIEEAVKEFARRCESNKLGSCVLQDAEEFLGEK